MTEGHVKGPQVVFFCHLVHANHLLLCCSIKTACREIINQRLCCTHPNIIQFQEVFLTPDHLCIVSEYAPGGDLVDFIERHNTAHDRALTESEARRLFQQLIIGVDFCHQVSQSLPSVADAMLEGLKATTMRLYKTLDHTSD